jgi:hypothetical protein
MTPSEAAEATADETVLDGTQDSQGIGAEEGTGFTFDMGGTEEDAGFEPIPKGTYNATIEAVEFRMSQSSQQPMWSVTYALTDEPWAEKNRKLFGFVSFKKDQLPRAKSFLKRVAPELAELNNFNPEKVASEGTLLGRPCRLRVDIEKSEEYGNRNRVRDVLAARGGEGAGGEGGGGSFSL